MDQRVISRDRSTEVLSLSAADGVKRAGRVEPHAAVPYDRSLERATQPPAWRTDLGRTTGSRWRSQHSARGS